MTRKYERLLSADTGRRRRPGVSFKLLCFFFLSPYAERCHFVLTHNFCQRPAIRLRVLRIIRFARSNRCQCRRTRAGRWHPEILMRRRAGEESGRRDDRSQCQSATNVPQKPDAACVCTTRRGFALLCFLCSFFCERGCGVVLVFTLTCAPAYADRVGDGLLKNHYANNIRCSGARAARCRRFVGASEWCLNWSLLCTMARGEGEARGAHCEIASVIYVYACLYMQYVYRD